ncbi:MAG: UDP-N-acetylmuramoyl-L-alanine--D-glutamate ligase [Proteobacteria bacterium]|nr:UDP-N-acetylmuramoyl-L-alanine--D-glutamate ligase [Pseudomonadota bacterium]
MSDTHAVVAGLGVTGMSAVRYLSSRGATVSVVDTRAHPPAINMLQAEFPGVPCTTVDDSLNIGQADMIVLSPGLSRKHPSILDAESNGVRITSDVQLYSEEARWPNLLVTGSNGKTTVTTLLGEILSAAGKQVFVGGNIGTPVLDSLLSGNAYSCAVLELSSFQLELIEGLTAIAAVILNVTPDHMDRYDTFAEYRAAKAHIYDGAGCRVYWRDDPCLDGYLSPVTDDIAFGLSEPMAKNDYGLRDSGGDQTICRAEEPLLAVSKLAVRGNHNVLNVMACWAMAHQAGVDDSVIAKVVSAFSGLPHRMQVVGSWRGVTWINDSKATNIGATSAALDGFSDPVILLAGGQGKGGDFDDLNRVLLTSSVKLLVLFGVDAGLIEKHIDAVDTVVMTGLGEAVKYAARQAQNGDTVMLSPACASFDLFSGYEDRGKQFIRAVESEYAGELG